MFNLKEKLYCTEESSDLKQKAFTIALLILMGTALIITSGLQVNAQSPYGLYIAEVTQQGGTDSVSYAYVGDALTLYGYLNTQSGAYQVFLQDTLVASGNAEDYVVTVNFTVPLIPQGSYPLVLRDVSAAANTTTALSVLPTFSITPIVPTAPAQLQEGNIVTLNVTVAGADANMALSAVVSVTSIPLETNYTKTVTFTASSQGVGQVLVPFPDASFSPSGSSTAYMGTYAVYFNASETDTSSLAQNSFTIGFTDATQYHRGDTVTINALDYQPNQVTTVAVKLNDEIIHSETVTASSQGAVTTTWVVPSNVSLGTYSIAITPLTTPSKTVVDVQTISILGYPVNFEAVNLANEPVSQILFEATDQSTGTVYNATTGTLGNATINLEKGTYAVTAYWKQVKVGETSVVVSGNNSYTVNCQLTDLKIKVQDKNGVVIPFVNLNLTYQFVDRYGTTQTASDIGQTAISGIYSFNSTLPGISYHIAASKYDEVFNTGNSTIVNLPTQPSSQYTILCPDETLTLTTVDYNFDVLPNARVILIEQASGMFYSLTTDSSGNAQIQVTFGQYRVDVYTSDNVLLNETVVNVLSNTQSQIRCVLYNLPVSVKVVDYFGNGISNVNVQLSRTGMSTLSATTKSDGTATFNNVIGGSMEITAYLSGNQNSYVATNLQVDSSATVNLTMTKYVVLAGMAVEASALATIIIIILAVLLFVGIEVFQRKGFRLPRKLKS
jgi:hypothetical protein